MALLPEDPEAHVRFLDHRDVVSAVTNGRGDRAIGAVLDELDYL